MSVPVSELLNRLQFETDHAPDSSPEWKRRAIYMFDKAQKRLIRDAPFMSREVEVRAVLDPDIYGLSPTDVLETTSDPWVLKVALQYPGPTTGPAQADWNLETEERHGGKMLRIKSPSDQPTVGYPRTHEFVIREVWKVFVESPGPEYHIYISLDRPYTGAPATDLQYRAFTRDLHLPAGIGQIRHIKVHDHPDAELEAYTSGQYDEDNYARYSLDNRVDGTPSVFTRGQTSFLAAPHVAPVVAVNDGGSWIGPEPQGSFLYALRLIMGKQEMWLHSGNPSTQTLTTPAISRLRPWLQSALGPASSRASNTGSPNVVQLTFPNFDFAEGFDGAGSLREHRSGFRVQIWRRRLTSDASLDFDSRFYLLDEVPADIGTYVDNGSVTPDRNSPAPGYGSVQPSLKVYPAGDQRYELIIRGVQELTALKSETQIPNVDVMAVDLLVHLAKAYLYEAQGNTSYSRQAFVDYQMALEGVMRRTASAIPRSRIISLRPGGSSGQRRRFQYRNDRPSKIES